MTEPQLTITTRENDGQLILGLAGEVDLLTAPNLEVALTGATREISAPDSLVVDTTEVTFFGSAGIGALMAIYADTKANGVALVVVAPPESPTRRTLAVLALDQTLPIADALGPPRRVRAVPWTPGEPWV
jgi:anti-sigma B factor antagonist